MSLTDKGTKAPKEARKEAEAEKVKAKTEKGKATDANQYVLNSEIQEGANMVTTAASAMTLKTLAGHLQVP